MPHTDTIPVSASIASTGKGIRYVQNWAYAMSGATSVNNDETVLLEFTTGSGIIYADFGFWYATAVGGGNIGDDYLFRILFNDLLILTQNNNASKEIYHPNYPKLIIPPFTLVTVSAQNSTDTSANDISATLTGRVYGAE